MTKEEIIKYFNETKGFSKHNKIILDSIEDGKVFLSCKLDENSLNPLNIAHGGLIFGIGDNACGILAFMTGTKAVTINSDINYLRPCQGKYIKCIAYPVKEGEKIGTYKAEIYNDKEELASIMTCTYYFIKKENEK